MKLVPSCRLSAKALTALLCAWLFFAGISDAHAGFGTIGTGDIGGLTINPTIDTASSNNNYTGNTTSNVTWIDGDGNWHAGPQTASGKSAAPGVSNFSITSNGICRYIDNKGTGTILIPFNTKPEWQAFIGNVGGSIYLDLCRMPYDLNKLGDGTKIDFASVLSTYDTSIAANLRVAPDSATTATMPLSTLARVNTNNSSDFTTFKNLFEDYNGAYVHFTRQDCRTINYPDGTSEDVCNPTTWYEQTKGRFKYTLPSAYNTIAALRTIIRTEAGDLGGTWNMTPSRTGGPPALNPPAIRNCSPYVNGQHWWVDVGPQVVNDPCPAGQVGSPQDPRRRTYILQRDYQCYDGKSLYGAYPTPATQEKPGSSSYLDTCVVAVSCGAANGGIINSKPSAAADLCGGGTASAVSGSGSTANPWAWTCTTGTVVASCSANKIACGSADGSTPSTKPSTNLCNNGSSASSVTGSGTSGSPWAWTCSGTSGTPAACSAQKPVTCSKPGGGTMNVGDTITMYSVSSGTSCPSQTRTCQADGTVSGTYAYTSCTVVAPPVTCAKPGGGTMNVGDTITMYSVSSGTSCPSQTRTCQSSGTLSGSYGYTSCTVTAPPVNGSCGTASDEDGGPLSPSMPTSGLCATGSPTSITTTGGGAALYVWYWSCNGSNGGSSASCHATERDTGRTHDH